MMSRIPLRAARVCVASATALALWAGPAGAQPSGPGSRTGQGPHVRVELIADRAAPGPGMRLGLKFDAGPGVAHLLAEPGGFRRAAGSHLVVSSGDDGGRHRVARA